jgi:hypothetical protein
MSILSLIKKVCVQDAVYWPYESNTGYEPSYGAPQSIKCRWDGSSEVLTDKQGKQIVASAEILCPTKLEEEGLIWLGTLSSLSSEQRGDPRIIPGIAEVRKVSTTPLFKSTTKFVYQIYV